VHVRLDLDVQREAVRIDRRVGADDDFPLAAAMAFRFASYGFSAASSEPSLRVATSSVSIETAGSGYSPSRRSKSSVRSPSSRARNAPFKTMVGVIVTPDFAIRSMTSLYACAVALCFGV